MATAAAATRRGGDLSQQGAQAPGAEQRLLPARRRPDRRGTGDREEGARLHGDEGPADHQQVLVEDAFPFELLPSFKELNIGGLGIQGYGCAGGSQMLFGFVAMELARIDRFVLHLLRRA